jgi:hypothetical protein
VTKRFLKALKTVRTHSPREDSAGFGQVNKKSVRAKQLAKSTDPAFMKFTTYIRKTTHLGVKTRLVSKEKELSDLVEELLSNWLQENESFDA